MTEAITAVTHDQHEHPPADIMRWLTTTNHKDLGILYMSFGGIMFFIGGAFIMAVRAELLLPGLQLLSPGMYNQLFTLHALIMVFGAIMPFATGLNNYLIPLMIGAPDMALPRVNNWGFWILPFAAVLLLIPFFLQFFGIGSGATGAGWLMHNTSLDLQSGIGMDFAIFTIHLLGLSSLSGAINVVVTVLNMRAPGMALMKMPLFVWAWLITAFMLILSMPVFSAAATMLLTDRHFGTHFFDAANGGDPILLQHLIWFFGHPEVYIVLLPTWGLIPHILATFSRKPVYGYRAQVYALWAICFLSFLVWAHHMLTSGLPLAAEVFFMYSTMAISIPTSVLVFCWIGAIWRGAMTFETPMLFALGFVAHFGMGALTGLILPDVAVNAQYHNSYVIVSHFHYTFFGGGIFGMMAALYYWLPKFTGRMFDEKLGRLHFWLTVIFFNMTFIPQWFAGLNGMPRHIADYALRFSTMNFISSIGAFLLGASQLLLVYIVVKCVRSGSKATGQVWEGAQGLEFTLHSPPPYHTFETPPAVK